jgi:MoxR-like ATPase
MLEAMGERRVTVDGQAYVLKAPFLVIATQNPIDHEGTFPLPEAQLDRYLLRLSLGYPSIEEESSLLVRLQRTHPIDELNPVVSAADVLACQEGVRAVYVDDKVRHYVLQIIHATRRHSEISLGASPRASIALFRTGQALAAINNREFVLPDDIKRMALPVLGHRLILKPESRLRKWTVAKIVQEILDEVPVPVLKSQNQAKVEDAWQ